MSQVKGDTRQTGKKAESQTTNHPYWFNRIFSQLPSCSKTHTNKTNKDIIQRKNIKSSNEKQQVIYKANPICITADLSVETQQAKRE